MLAVAGSWGIVTTGLVLITIHLIGVFVSREVGIALHSLWLASILWPLWKAWQARHVEAELRQSIIMGIVTWLSWWSFSILLEKLGFIKSDSVAWWLIEGMSLLGIVYGLGAWWRLARLREAKRSVSSLEKKDHGQVS